jgi:8-oxo-dGTP diphosphatase
MKHIHVTCAIIERDGLVLAVQRSDAMSLPLKWEFPGGKVDLEESHEECLCRELVEELGLRVTIKKSLAPTTHQYPLFIITLYPFVCSVASGELELYEHAALRWLRPSELEALDWAAADIPVVDAYRRSLREIDK